MAIHVLSICCYAKLFCHAPPYPKAWKSAQNIGEISFCVKCEHGLEFASKNTKTFIKVVALLAEAWIKNLFAVKR